MRRILACLATVVSLIAQTTYAPSGSPHRYYNGNLPTSSTTIVGGGVYLMDAVFSTGSSGTITITDNSTDCAGSPCARMNAVAIAAGTSYFTFGNAFMPGGIVANSTGTIAANIHWSTQPPSGSTR